jgi:4-alpha-glucanotransferase
MSERKSGILLHISSLPCEFGIGDLGPCAYRFADFLHEAKQAYWQILPINQTCPITGYSPYSSPSAFAANTLFISPRLLVKEGILHEEDVNVKPDFPAGTVDYDAVRAYKTGICHRAYERFASDVRVRRSQEKGINDFTAANAFWLEDYALFETIKDHFDRTIWTAWPKALRKRESGALRDFAKTHKDEINEIKLLQYLFFKQWDGLKDYCAKKSIRLMGDMPIYMDMDSVDVWTKPQNYKLDGEFRPVVVAGVPPDYFSATGQRWGNPVYDWDALRESQFSWWVERFRFNFRLFDVVRIDHFRGLVQCWEIPAPEQTAVNGQWADVPTDDFFNKLQECFLAPLPIIAEDLGYITEDVRDAMRRFGFPGMKVLLFAFNGNMEEHPYLPHNYEERCVVYTGTHDNNTVSGWFQDEASDQEIANIQHYIGKELSAGSVHWDFIRMAMESPAGLAIIPMQDILGLGSDARMNTPATNNGNWRWRVSPEAFDRGLLKKLRDLTLEAKRC